MEARTELAVEELHRLYAQNVYRYVYRRIRDTESARQITNDAFRLAWQRDITVGTEALPWLLVTAKNLISNEVRALAREQKLTLKITEQYGRAAENSSSLLNESVQSVLESLREKDREVLMLTYWDGLTTAELAAVLNCSVESAKSRLFRARKIFARKAPTSMLKGGTN